MEISDINGKKIVNSTIDDHSLNVRLEDEFNSTIAARLGVYLVDEMHLSLPELKQLLKEMKDSYILHRTNGESPIDWFVRIKKNILEFASLRDLQREYNELIDQKRDTLAELGLDANEFELQKINRGDFLSLLIERLRADCEDIALMRNYHNYRNKLVKLATTISNFKKNYNDLQVRFKDSQGNLAHFQGENAGLKAEIEEFKNQNSLIKNRFNRILNRFSDANRLSKINSAKREKKLVETIKSLNEQLDYWKNKHPKWLVSHVAAEFKNKIRLIVSQFEQQSAKLSEFYVKKFQGLKDKDTTIFKKYNEVVNDYENQRRNLLGLLDSQTKKFDQIKEKLNTKVISERAKYTSRIESQKTKMRTLREKYEEKIARLNQTHQQKLKIQKERATSQPEQKRVSNRPSDLPKTKPEVVVKKENTKKVEPKATPNVSQPEPKVVPKSKPKVEINNNPSPVVDDKVAFVSNIKIIKKSKSNSVSRPPLASVQERREDNKTPSPKRELIDIIGETKYTLQRKAPRMKKPQRKLSLIDEIKADLMNKKRGQKK